MGMMSRQRRASFLLFSVLIQAFSAADCLGSPLRDFYIRQALDRYFALPGNAETLSLAGSTAMTCSGADCLYLNPAGLGFLPVKEFSSTLGFSLLEGDDFIDGEPLEQNEYHGYGVLAVPFGSVKESRPRYGALAIGYSRYDGHTNDSIHTHPDGHTRSIAYAYAPTEELSVGYTFVFYDDQLHTIFSDLHSHSRLLHVWGTQFRPTEDLEFGGLFQLGIGQSDTEDFRFDSNGLLHLRQYSGQLGVTKTFSSFKVALSFDYTRAQSQGHINGVAFPVTIGGNESGNIYNIRLGVEKKLQQNLSLRSGFRWYEVESYEFQRADLQRLSGNVQGMGFSLGVGYRFGKGQYAPSLDYGSEYLLIGDGAWEHLLSLKVPFHF